jgi:tRNA modification GTPase
MIFETTICAPATSGSGAISVIRISGPNPFEITNSIFHSPSNKKLDQVPPNSVHFGEIVDNDEIIDEVLISVFRAPHSYTGEDSLEISCHASPYIQKRILELLIERGASMAQPGEFTQRAFLNGKMDLTQAEAVADLISSENRASHRIALNQLRGGFSNELANLRVELLHFTSMIELELDFSEEDVEFANRNDLMLLINNMLKIIGSLINSFKKGNVIKNGIPVAIIGKPNVGKSSLLNRLLNEEKAIVSEIAGTTRDSIEDTIRIGDITYRFIDTAGIRETADSIESLGIRKTYQKIDQSAIILLLADVCDQIEIIIASFLEIRKQIEKQDKQLILVLNKTDIAGRSLLKDLTQNLRLDANEFIVEISAKHGMNIQLLEDVLLRAAKLGDLEKDDVVISNVRHYEALVHTFSNLNRLKEGLTNGLTSDLLAQDLRQALHYIGGITGQITTDEVLGNIFKNFCIGK